MIEKVDKKLAFETKERNLSLSLHPQILQTYNLLTKQYESVRDRFHFNSRFV